MGNIASTNAAWEALRHRRAFLVDLDGVVYTGDTAIAGAAEFFAFLRQSGRRFQCITNNSTLTAAHYVRKLGAMGVSVTEAQILTSSQATAVYVREHAGAQARLMAIGEDGLVRALLNAGFMLTERSPDVVVCGLDRRLTYERLTRACLAIRAGASLVATNPDFALPTESGFLPGNGATLAYLQTATGVAPLVVGKPQATMLHVAMNLLGVSSNETAIIGDGLDTDILAGERAGVMKLLVLTGVATRADLPAAPAAPDLVFEDLAQLQEALRYVDEH